jgi:hypothetical protein
MDEEQLDDLDRRLRGEYRIPITDGLGPAGGDEPDNAAEFVRHFETPPIQHEAAEILSKMRESLDAWRSEAATFRRLLESKQEELAREQKLREDLKKAHNIERIQWRESLREKDEETQRWRRQAESKY